MSGSRAEEMLGEVVIPDRFNGPATTANGGYAAGRLAAFVDAPAVAVRLAAPPPLERRLSVLRSGDDGHAVELRDGTQVVASAAPAVALDLEVPARIDPAAAALAAARTPMRVELHPFPTCFGCGPLREAGDALRHIPGPAADGVMACPMTTDPALPHDEAGSLREEIVWAALDCPSAAATVPVGARPHVLGSFVVQIDRPIPVGSPHVCVAWSLGAEGRKRYGASAILDAEGRRCAVARAVWIEVR